MTKPIALFVNSATDYSIVDGKNRPVTIEDAKRLYESGAVQDYNIAFRRLAELNFDIEALKAHYKSGGRA